MFRRSKELEKKKKSIKAVAIYDNLGGLANELEFSKGDIINVIERNSDGRWKGELNNLVGYFPMSFVELIDNFVKNDEPPHVKQMKEKDRLIFELFAALDISHRRENWYVKQQMRRNMERKHLELNKSKPSPQTLRVKDLQVENYSTVSASPNTLRNLGHVKFQRKNKTTPKPSSEFLLLSLNEPTILDLEVFEMCYKETPLYQKSKQEKILVDPVTKEEVMVKLQFARDCLNLIRINGRPIEGNSDEEKVRNARNMILEYTEHDYKKTKLVMELATQNLGIWLYDSYMQKYLINSDKPLLMSQTGCHYIDVLMEKIVTEEKQLEIYFMGLFKIQEEDSLEDLNSAYYLKTTIEIDLMKSAEQVKVCFSQIVDDLWKLIPERQPISSLSTV